MTEVFVIVVRGWQCETVVGVALDLAQAMILKRQTPDGGHAFVARIPADALIENMEAYKI